MSASQCRSIMHAWNYYDVHIRAGRVNNNEAKYIQTLECARCGTIKLQHLNFDGLLLKTRYVYPSGYLNKGQGRMTAKRRGFMRLEAMDGAPWTHVR